MAFFIMAVAIGQRPCFASICCGALGVFVLSYGRFRLCQLGKITPRFGHLEKPRLVAIVCG
jgi:hypothetical protein